MPPRRNLCYCFGKAKVAESNIRRAEKLISSGCRNNVLDALVPLNAALELYPHSERALELKARALLYLKRFKEVIEMLYEFLPSFNNNNNNNSSCLENSPAFTPEKGKLLAADSLFGAPHHKQKHRYNLAAIIRRLSSGASKGPLHEVGLEWRYLILGQACYHMGMMEDATVLLQIGKKTACDALRRHSNGMRDDNFCSDHSITHTVTCPAEFTLVNHMIANIKLLLRRRAAALAALEAGLYTESVRHFSKITEGQKGTPPWFIADCYLHRAIAYQATGKVIDAIADCNRNLALNPKCTKALSVRASLHEMVKSFSECLLDLQQLKMIFEASLRSQGTVVESVQWTIQQRVNGSDIDISGGLDYINSKIIAIRRRLCHGACSLDARTILSMPENCSMEDVEKAYLLLSLKHSPDKAALFLDSCCQQLGQQDCYPRDMETVKEEAKASAVRLSKLIHKAYTKLLSVISEKQSEERRELHMGIGVPHHRKRSSCNAPKSEMLGQYISKTSQHREHGLSSLHQYPANVENRMDSLAEEERTIEHEGSNSSSSSSSDVYNNDRKISDSTKVSSDCDGKIDVGEVVGARVGAQNDIIRVTQELSLGSQDDTKLDQNLEHSSAVSSCKTGSSGNEVDKSDIAIVLEAFRGLYILGDGWEKPKELAAVFLVQGRVGWVRNH